MRYPFPHCRASVCSHDDGGHYLNHPNDVGGASPGVIAGLLKLNRQFGSKSKIWDKDCQISSFIADPRYNKAFVGAILTENNALVKHLLSLGTADVNFHDGKMTVLQHAAAAGNEDLVQYLMEHGANVNAEARGDRGKTAPQAASERRHPVFSIVRSRRRSGQDRLPKPSPVRALDGLHKSRRSRP